MSHRSKIIKEWIDIQVTAENQRFEDSFEVDKHAAAIIGIALTSNADDSLYYRGSQRLSINEIEIFPEGYESKMLMQGINVAANDRIIKLGEEIEPGNRKVKLEYTDTSPSSFAVFSPYKVRLYVFSRIDDPKK